MDPEIAVLIICVIVGVLIVWLGVKMAWFIDDLRWKFGISRRLDEFNKPRRFGE